MNVEPRARSLAIRVVGKPTDSKYSGVEEQHSIRVDNLLFLPDHPWRTVVSRMLPSRQKPVATLRVVEIEPRIDARDS
jgi:hypothetical protein